MTLQFIHAYAIELEGRRVSSVSRRERSPLPYPAGGAAVRDTIRAS